MYVVLKVKMTERRPIGIVRDRWREILRKAFRAVGEFWAMTFAKRHFEPGAAERYHYARRTARYMARKDRQLAAGRSMSKGEPRVIAGSDTPLVLTGRMRDMMLQHVVIRSFQNHVSVTLLGPAYTNAKLGRGGKARGDFSRHQPNKPREITVVTPDEHKALKKVLADQIMAGIGAIHETRVSEAA
jgi:hypothetical protein